MGLLSDLYEKYGQPLINDVGQGAQAIGSAVQQNVIQPAQQLGAAAVNEIQAAPAQVQGVLGGVRNLLQPVEQSVSNFNQGTTEWQKNGQQWLNENVSPFGNGPVGQAVDYLGNRVNNGNLIPTASGVGAKLFPGAQKSISDYESQHPVANFIGGVGQGILNLPSTTGNVFSNTATDLANISENRGANGYSTVNYNQLNSPLNKLGYQISDLATPGAGPGSPQRAQDYLANAGGVVANMVLPFVGGGAVDGALEKAAAGQAENQTARQVVNNLVKSGVKASPIGAGFGFAGSLEANRNAATVPDQLKSTIIPTLAGAGTGFALGVGGEGAGYLKDSAVAAANELKTTGTIRRPGFVDVGATGNPPPPPGSPGQVPDSFIQTAKNKGGFSDETNALLPDLGATGKPQEGSLPGRFRVSGQDFSDPNNPWGGIQIHTDPETENISFATGEIGTGGREVANQENISPNTAKELLDARKAAADARGTGMENTVPALERVKNAEDAAIREAGLQHLAMYDNPDGSSIEGREAVNGKSPEQIQSSGKPPPPGSPSQVPDSFIQTAKNKGGLSDETKALLPDTFHDERSTPDAVARNTALAASNPEAAAQVLKNGGDEGVFAGLALARLKGQEGDSVAQADLLKTTNANGIEQGRAIQALSTIDASTPEGMAMIAQHEMNKVSAPQSDSITKNANDIKAAVEKSAVLTPEETTKAAQTVAERSTRPDIQQPETSPNGFFGEEELARRQSQSKRGIDWRTGEKMQTNSGVVNPPKQSTKTTPDQATQLSKRVIAQVTPSNPKQGDILVSELTKIAKRDLPTPEKAPAQSAIDRIKQLFLMHEYDPNVYNDAKAIVQEHFKDNPDALKAIADYEKSNPSIPVDKSTLAKAVRDEIKGRGDDLSSIVKNLLPTDQANYPELVAQGMREKGFSGPATDTFLESLKQEVAFQMAVKKAAAIKQMQQSGPQRSNPTFEEKLNKINNLGVLEDSDYTDLAKAKLNLPNLNGESMKEISSRVNKINEMPEGRDKESEKTKLYNYIADQVPSSLGEKAVSLLRTGFLSHIKLLVNKVFPAHVINTGVEAANDVFSSKVIDPIIGAVSGQRGTTVPMRGTVEGVGKGLGNARDVALTGRTAETTPEQYIGSRTNMGNSIIGKAFQAYTDVVQRLHGVLPTVGETQAAVRHMYDQAHTAAYNAGLKGDAVEKFVQDFVTNPSDKAVEAARYHGQRAALTNPTRASEALEGMREKGGAFMKAVYPMVRVGSAAATGIMDYSPIGIVKAPLEAWGRYKKEGEFTPNSQSLLSKGIGRAALGSLAIGAGVLAAKSGLTSNKSKDASERDLKESQGIPDNSVRFPGTNKWYPYTSLGPIGGALATGSYYNQGEQDTKKRVGTVGSAIFGGVKGLAESQLEQPALGGFTPLAEALKNPERWGNQFVSSTVKSVVPGFVSDIASAMDPNQRVTTTDNTADSIKNNLQSTIPGLRQDLPVKNSVVGQPLANPAYLPSALNTTAPNQAANPAIQELARLSATGNAATPTPLGRNLTTLGVQQNLSPQQQSDLQGIRGKEYSDNIASLVQTPEYQALSDPNKALALKKLQTLVDARTGLYYAANNPLTQTNQGGQEMNTTQANDQIKLQAASAMQQGDGKKFFDLVSTLPRAQQTTVANEIQQSLGIDIPGKTNSPVDQVVASLSPTPVGPNQHQVTAANYLNNFESFQRHAQFEKYNPDHDPLYELTQERQKAILIARSQSVDGQSTPLAAAIKAESWYKPFAQAESAYIAAHPLTQTAGSASTPQAPAFPTGTPSKADLKTYYAQLDQYNAQKLVGLGATPEEAATAQANQRIASLAVWKSQNGIGGSSASGAARRAIGRISRQANPSIHSSGGGKGKVVRPPGHSGTMKVSIPTRSPIKMPHVSRA